MIVMLIIVALLLVAAIAARYHRGDAVVNASATEINRFEREVDTATIVTAKPESPKPDPVRTRKRNARPASKPKPSPGSRRLDPVPAF